MDFSNILAQALFWPGYQVVNPTTTPTDVQRLSQAVALTPGIDGVVRILEKRPDINGKMLDDGAGHPIDRDLWISREGPHYKSKNPHLIASTVVHENAHLQGANESGAREKQLAFLDTALKQKARIPAAPVNELRELHELFLWLEDHQRRQAEKAEKAKK